MTGARMGWRRQSHLRDRFEYTNGCTDGHSQVGLAVSPFRHAERTNIATRRPIRRWLGGVSAVVGDETWNVLHGFSDNLDPHADGRAPHTYVEESPRLEWENAFHYDLGTDSYTYTAMNVGQTPISPGVIATVTVTFGNVGLRGDHCIGWTDSGQPAGPGEPMKFTVWLDRPLTRDDLAEIELTLPDANGGAKFTPGLSGDLQARARGEKVD